MANRSRIKTSAPLIANKRIKQSGNGRKTVKLAVNRNKSVRIKKS